jgi:hypothetical protein
MRDLRHMAVVATGFWLRSSALLVAIMLIAPGTAGAAICNPTTAAELVTAINDTNAGNCPNNTITLTQGAIYAFATPNHTGDGSLGDATLPAITGTVVIEDNGAIIERSLSAGTPRLRLILTGGNLTLNNATLRNGAAQEGGNNISFGGCVFNLGSLTVRASTVTNCSGVSSWFRYRQRWTSSHRQ